MPAIPVIRSPDTESDTFLITKTFLEHVFEKPIQSFEITAGSNNGENFGSVLHTVYTKFENEEEDRAILIKSLPDHPARQFFVSQTQYFPREYFIYEEMLPELQKLIKDEESFKLPVAPYLGGNVPDQRNKFTGGPWADHTFIIMTDVRHKLGFRNTDRRKGLDLDHASLIMKTLGTVHGLSWTYKKKNDVRLLSKKFPLLEDSAFSDSTKAKKLGPLVVPLFEQAITLASDLIKDALGNSHPAVEGLSQLLKPGVSQIQQIFMDKEGINEDIAEDLLRIKPDEDCDYVKDPWLLMTHGDCWSNNFLFKYDDPSDASRPTDVIMVDFQFTREVCPTMDLAYLLMVSLRTEKRKVIENQLLEIYYQTFCDICAFTTTEILPGFTFDNLLRRYRRAKIFGLMMALPCLYFFLLPPEAAVDLDDSSKDCETMNDIVSGTFAKGATNLELKNELAHLILDLYEDGIL